MSKLVHTSSGDSLLINLAIEDDQTNTIGNLPKKINIQNIIYFACSVFWRYSIATVSNFHGNLGKKYTEEIRRYLMGDKSFPFEARICLVTLDTRPPNEHFAIISEPMTSRENGYSRHLFQLIGFQFIMFLGEEIPLNINRFCLHRATQKITLISNIKTDPLNQFAAKIINKSVPKGKLVKDW